MNLRELATSWHGKGPILLTGHTGFKGTWLTLLLRELGIPIVGFSLEAQPGSMYCQLQMQGKIPEVFADIRDRRALGKTLQEYRPSAVIHLAAQALVRESYMNPYETFEINIMGAVNLLQAVAGITSVEGIVISTTDKVYRNDNQGRSFVEDDPLGGIDPYSASKVGTEAAIRAWQNILSKRKRLISVRAGNVIGGGDFSKDRLIPDCIRAHQTKGLVKVRNPRSTRPWQHVLEPLSGYLYALIKGTHPAYNFGPQETSNLTVEEVVQALQKHISFEYEIDEENSNLYESTLLSLNSNLANQDLGWYPQFSQEEAIFWTSQWWSVALSGGDLLSFTNSQVRSFANIDVSSVITT